MGIRPIVWMRAVRDAAPKFSTARQHVLLCLGLRMGANGAGYASARQLAEDADVSLDTAQRATVDARRRAYLVRTRRGHRISDATAIASEWSLTVPSQPETQGRTGAVLAETQGRTGAVLGGDPKPQNRKAKAAEKPTQSRTGAAPRGLSPEDLSHQQTAARSRARSTLLQFVDEDRADLVLDYLDAEREIRDLAAYVAKVAGDSGIYSLADLADEWREGLAEKAERDSRAEFIAERARDPYCDHGYPGGHIRDETGWMTCPIQRKDEP